MMIKRPEHSRSALRFHREALFGQGTSIGSTEGELLDRFVRGRDGAAFEALVARHGPMVLVVCRQLLRDPNDVDDAFQATFLILVRKASTLRRCDLLGNWLYGVAYRVAARARSQSARRSARVASEHDSAWGLSVAECRPAVGTEETPLMDQAPLLHKELSVLPEKYRVPIVLCYFEGLTHDEAASRLGWPLGTVKGRLARARDLLRRRLTSRGVTLSVTGLASQLAAFEAKAAVPASLQMITLKGAQALAHELGVSLATNSVASIPAYALAQGVLHTMIANQVKTVALSLLLVAGTVATGVGVAATRMSDRPANGKQVNQVHPASTVSGKSQSSGPGAQAIGRMTENAASSISPLLVQHLRAERTTFDQLLSRFSDPGIEDIDRLYNWSYKTLEADQALGTTDADRLAAYEAHRDRMKKLLEFTEKIPVSHTNQPVKADHARNILEQAEEGLNNVREGAATPGMTGMMNMMRGANVSMGRVPGMMPGGGGQMGMMGSGGAIGGMMGMMGKPGAAPIPNAKPATKDTRDQRSKATGSKDQATTQSFREPDTLGAKGPKQTAATMGGMGGAGGMMGMGGSLSPGVNRRLRSSIALSTAELAAHETNPQSTAILKKLETRLSMSFDEGNSLEQVLRYVKQSTADENYPGIPIYVDPAGLKEADATLQSPVKLELDGVPLKTTLRLMLKQIGLAYCVRDGVLIVSSVRGIAEELEEAQSERRGTDLSPGGGGGLGGGAFGGNPGGGMM